MAEIRPILSLLRIGFQRKGCAFMEENHDIFAEAFVFLKKRRLERMGIHAELRAVKILREEPGPIPNQERKDSA